jgi:outer membrane protein OmpA-like peptidoglycan-associated protein
MQRDLLFTMALAFVVTPGIARIASAEPMAKAGSTSPREEFALHPPDEASRAETAKHAKLKPTRTEAALRFLLVDKDKGPIQGTVIALTGADGKKYFTEETDDAGYTEVLVPVGQKYDVVYLSLGMREIAAQVTVTDEPKQSIKLTLRYKRPPPPPPIIVPAPPATRFILDGVNFDTGKATLRPDSVSRLDSVVEFMAHKKNARIEISGHTDNVGKKKDNQLLSERRAQACRDYLVSKGIARGRIATVGYGDERPIASNEMEGGRRLNRRIEAIELQ